MRGCCKDVRAVYAADRSGAEITACLSTKNKEAAVPLFLIERNFAEELLVDDAMLSQIRQINDEIGIQWLYSFLSADKRKTYCLYEAESGEAIRDAARRAGLPADIVIELAGELRPEAAFA